ncbi:MAG TPA: hypothetical protein VJR28_04915 [Chthoniobacterales bacterium]|nr:hypothetical protein [Chthoniobacterales bacterium]
MKAIVLTFDRHRAITEHLILQYQRIWPDHPFRFRIPYQLLRGPDSDHVKYIESPPEITSTVLRLIEDIEDEEWIYWCSDDKYPIHLIVEKIKELLNYALATSEISGLLFCRTRVTLDQPELSLLPHQRITPVGDVLLERKGWYQIWIHQFLKAKVLRSLFSQLPLEIPSAKALDALKDQIPKPDEYRLFVTEQNFAVFGESTKRGVITRNCLESIRRTGIELPEWFQRSNGEWVTMGKLPGKTPWQRLRSRVFSRKG